MFLGGKDFDERLVNYLAEQFLDRPRHRSAQRSAGRRAIVAGRPGGQARPLRADEDHGGLLPRRASACGSRSTRGQFEEITRDLLERTETTASLVRAAGGPGLAADRPRAAGRRIDAGCRWSRGCSASSTGKEPDCSQSPDEAVAHGAALYAGMLHVRRRRGKPSCELVNVNSHSLGVVGIHPKTGQRTVNAS